MQVAESLSAPNLKRKKPEYPPSAASRGAVARGVRPMGDAGYHQRRKGIRLRMPIV